MDFLSIYLHYLIYNGINTIYIRLNSYHSSWRVGLSDVPLSWDTLGDNICIIDRFVKQDINTILYDKYISNGYKYLVKMVTWFLQDIQYNMDHSIYILHNSSPCRFLIGQACPCVYIHHSFHYFYISQVYCTSIIHGWSPLSDLSEPSAATCTRKQYDIVYTLNNVLNVLCYK